MYIYISIYIYILTIPLYILLFTKVLAGFAESAEGEGELEEEFPALFASAPPHVMALTPTEFCLSSKNDGTDVPHLL